MTSMIVFMFLTIVQCLNFFEVKFALENKSANLGKEMERIYESRCADENIRGCSVKSYNMCEGTPTRSCQQSYPKLPTCQNDQVYVSETTITRTNNNLILANIPQQTKQFICSTAQIPQKWFNKSNYSADTFTYIGGVEGSIRIFPSIKFPPDQQFQGCSNYDSRLRPWFATSTIGSKNIIIMVSVDANMNSLYRMTNTKEALHAFVSTMSNQDYLTIITFSNQIHQVLNNSSVLIKLNATNRILIQSFINQLTPQSINILNYDVAIKKGLEILKQSIQTNKVSLCQDYENLFMMFVDQKPAQGSTTKDQFKTIISNQNLNIAFFGFLIAHTVETIPVVKQLSCQYKGIVFEIRDVTTKSSFLTKIFGLIELIKEGTRQSKDYRTTGSWSQPYIDHFGYGEIVTISTPIFTRVDNNFQKLIGVAAVDVPMQELVKYRPRQGVLSSLNSELLCFRNNLEMCYMEYLRGANGRCFDATLCQNFSQTSSLQCSDDPIQTNDIFVEPQDTSNDRCCQNSGESISLGLIVGISIGCLVMVLILIVLLWYMFFYRKESNSISSTQTSLPKITTSREYDNFPHKSRIKNSQSVIQKDDILLFQ